ncbi:collagen alpha-1(I) chain-like [Lepus europaeus]|uniref:collagen alpha-1(I) chain-like n=1 Tax=Lepus europaeus TaxID=9983 RepID=UPI002B45F461|nr:collagen alpha-1(I) chain-like [Lepus europaeus]
MRGRRQGGSEKLPQSGAGRLGARAAGETRASEKPTAVSLRPPKACAPTRPHTHARTHSPGHALGRARQPRSAAPSVHAPPRPPLLAPGRRPPLPTPRKPLDAGVARLPGSARLGRPSPPRAADAAPRREGAGRAADRGAQPRRRVPGPPAASGGGRGGRKAAAGAPLLTGWASLRGGGRAAAAPPRTSAAGRPRLAAPTLGAPHFSLHVFTLVPSRAGFSRLSPEPTSPPHPGEAGASHEPFVLGPFRVGCDLPTWGSKIPQAQLGSFPIYLQTGWSRRPEAREGAEGRSRGPRGKQLPDLATGQLPGDSVSESKGSIHRSPLWTPRKAGKCFVTDSSGSPGCSPEVSADPAQTGVHLPEEAAKKRSVWRKNIQNKRRAKRCPVARCRRNFHGYGRGRVKSEGKRPPRVPAAGKQSIVAQKSPCPRGTGHDPRLAPPPRPGRTRGKSRAAGLPGSAAHRLTGRSAARLCRTRSFTRAGGGLGEPEAPVISGEQVFQNLAAPLTSSPTLQAGLQPRTRNPGALPAAWGAPGACNDLASQSRAEGRFRGEPENLLGRRVAGG